MAIGDGMLAQVLLDYFQQHAEEFEQFVLERAGIDEGYVRWRGEETHKRLVLKVTTLGSGPSTVSKREYAMRIEQRSSADLSLLALFYATAGGTMPFYEEVASWRHILLPSST
jgi:hypothetical protein